jgi:hypothetical protein
MMSGDVPIVAFTAFDAYGMREAAQSVVDSSPPAGIKIPQTKVIPSVKEKSGVACL